MGRGGLGRGISNADDRLHLWQVIQQFFIGVGGGFTMMHWLIHIIWRGGDVLDSSL